MVSLSVTVYSKGRRLWQNESRVVAFDAENKNLYFHCTMYYLDYYAVVSFHCLPNPPTMDGCSLMLAICIQFWFILKSIILLNCKNIIMLQWFSQHRIVLFWNVPEIYLLYLFQSLKHYRRSSDLHINFNITN